ncbi:MAG: WhiB family transcriptional regulator [Acidimicrobiales bacterium]|jgi:WhiB family redox-sensing transcriptional regulator|nr:WhiB family transcriptional regulator [Acidimicrobiales bacterium]HJM28609.1 WhiB family transcriptional regulator [Acidimicrobiales bacterium]HJM97996.1 WhiB family transcriptional regulator [Acidimicrobiales bacterium]
MSALLDDQGWQMRAACRGPQIKVFFPPAHFERKIDKRERERRAKMICRSCAVRNDCLDYALRIREQHGIWGGLNESERKEMLPVIQVEYSQTL